MKRQIRRGVFETNSSSMHSLTIMKKDEKYTTEEILNHFYLHSDTVDGKTTYVWDIWYENDLIFGRSPFRALGTFKDKWLYACASLVQEYNDDVYKELVEIAKKYIPNLTKIKMPMTNDGFADKTAEKYKDNEYYQQHGKTEEELIEYLAQKEKDWGIELSYWRNGDYWCFERPYTGGVDENVLGCFLRDTGITLEDFIINKKYVVIQDGDEYCYWSDMKKTGLVNTSIIDYEYPNNRYLEED